MLAFLAASVFAAPTYLKIAVGAEHCLFVESDGSLWVIGDNSDGQLSEGFGVSTTNIPLQLIASNVTTVAAGAEHSLFIKSDDSLWGMGDNAAGGLGDGTTVNRFFPEQIPASGMTTISGGGEYRLFRTVTGRPITTTALWGMGYDGDGELGDGTTIDRHLPVQIVPSNVVTIAAGGYSSLFIKSDGSLWVMGDNFFGKLGEATYTDKHSPIRIVPPAPSQVVTGLSFFRKQCCCSAGPTG